MLTRKFDGYVYDFHCAMGYPPGEYDTPTCPQCKSKLWVVQLHVDHEYWVGRCISCDHPFYFKMAGVAIPIADDADYPTGVEGDPYDRDSDDEDENPYPDDLPETATDEPDTWDQVDYDHYVSLIMWEDTTDPGDSDGLGVCPVCGDVETMGGGVCHYCARQRMIDDGYGLE